MPAAPHGQVSVHLHDPEEPCGGAPMPRPAPVTRIALPSSSPAGAKVWRPQPARTPPVPARGPRRERGPHQWSSDCPGGPVEMDRTRAPGANWEKRSAGVVFPRLPGYAVRHHGALMKGMATATPPAVFAMPLAAANGCPSRTIYRRLCQAHIWSAVSGHPRVHRLGRTRQRAQGRCARPRCTSASWTPSWMTPRGGRSTSPKPPSRLRRPPAELARSPGRRRSPPARPRRPHFQEQPDQHIETLPRHHSHDLYRTPAALLRG